MMTSFFSPKLKEKLRPIIGTTPLESRAWPRFFHFFCVALRRSPAVVSTQGVVAQKKTTTRYGGASRPSGPLPLAWTQRDRKSTRLNSSHRCISYAVFCLKKKTKNNK